MPDQERGSNYYDLLGLSPSASPQQIRRAYREKSKLYHPDTTELPEAIATAKFQALNEAYGTLSSPERRVAYDMKMGYSRVRVIQPPAEFSRSGSVPRSSRSAYLDPTDRPLSAGEIFALFILGVTFVACLLLVVAIGLTRGDRVDSLTVFRSAPVPADLAPVSLPDALPQPDSDPFVERIDAGVAPALAPDLAAPESGGEALPAQEPPSDPPPGAVDASEDASASAP